METARSAISFAKRINPAAMQAIKTPVLADSYPLQPRITEGYEPFFTGLLGFCADATIDEALAARIKTYVQGWLVTHPLDAFDRFSDESYLRTYLGRCPRTHWEAIVMSWKAGNRTSIHAHPQFAGYYFADGEFQVEIFEQAGPTALKLANVVRVNGQEGFAAIGHPGRFDNHIHRITCLSATAHSLHVYSDDALRGMTFVRNDSE